jgi:hypothetical protein
VLSSQHGNKTGIFQSSSPHPWPGGILVLTTPEEIGTKEAWPAVVLKIQKIIWKGLRVNTFFCLGASNQF